MPTFEELMQQRQSTAPEVTLSPLEQAILKRKEALGAAPAPVAPEPNPLSPTSALQYGWQRLTEQDVPPGDYWVEQARRHAVALGGSVGAIYGLRGGAALGAATGGPVGAGVGALAGTTLGGGLGVVAGTFAPEFTLGVMEDFGLVPPGTKEAIGRPMEEQLRMARGEAYLDAELGFLGQLPRQLIGRPLARATTRPGKFAPSTTGAKMPGQELARAAQAELGVTLMPWQVGGARAARAFLGVWGRFPIVSRPARQTPAVLGSARFTSGQRTTEAQLVENLERLPEKGGGHVRQPYDLSHAILQDAKELHGKWSNYFRTKYGAVWDAAEKNGVGVRLDNTRASALQIIHDINKRAATEGGVPAVGESRRAVVSWLEKNVLNLDATQQLRGLDTLVQEIDAQFLKEESKQNKFLLGKLNELRSAAVRDMTESVVPLPRHGGYGLAGIGLPTDIRRAEGMAPGAPSPMGAPLGPSGIPFAGPGPTLGTIAEGPGEYTAVTAQEIARRLRELDSQYSNVMSTIFETSTAKKFGRVERRGLTGTVWDPVTATPIGQLANVTLDMEDPTVVSELFALMKPQTQKDLVSSVLQEGMAQSWQQTREGFGSVGVRFNTDHFLDYFGFAHGKGARADVIREMLKQTDSPLSMDTLQLLAKTMDAASLTALPDPSVFMARRAQLGGGRAVITGMLGGLAGGSVSRTGAVHDTVRAGLIGMTISFLGVRGFIRAISNPAGSKALRFALREETGLGVFRANVLRLLRLGVSSYTDAFRHEGADVETVREVQKTGSTFGDALDKELQALESLSKRTSPFPPGPNPPIAQ